jgi:hypothetical protein
LLEVSGCWVPECTARPAGRSLQVRCGTDVWCSAWAASRCRNGRSAAQPLRIYANCQAGLLQRVNLVLMRPLERSLFPPAFHKDSLWYPRMARELISLQDFGKLIETVTGASTARSIRTRSRSSPPHRSRVRAYRRQKSHRPDGSSPATRYCASTATNPTPR